MTAAITIPPTWTTASSCLTSGDVYHWANDLTDIDALGSPGETSSCYPPSFTPTLGFEYAANTCPDGFTPACTTDYYATSWSTICCPSGGYSFHCAFDSFSSLTWGCVTSYTATATITVRGVSLAEDTTTTGQAYIATRTPGDKLVALGVGISSTSASSASGASVSNPTSTSSAGASSITSTAAAASSTAASSTGGISTGAAAGIGVSVALVGILLIIGGWFLYRRRARSKGGPALDDKTGPNTAAQDRFAGDLTQHEAKPSELPSAYQGHELDAAAGGYQQGHELDGNSHHRVELP